MTNDEIRALAERLDERTVDWNGERIPDRGEPRTSLDCGEYRAASAAIISLMRERDEARGRDANSRQMYIDAVRWKDAATARATLAEARLEKAVSGLERLASSECFEVPRATTAEERARLTYARSILSEITEAEGE